MDGYHAWKFAAAQRLDKRRLADIFPQGLSKVFSVVFTAKFNSATDSFALKIESGQTAYINIGVSVSLIYIKFNNIIFSTFNIIFSKSSGLSVSREGASDVILASLLPDVFDGRFHKFQIFFDDENVVAMVDCIQVGTLDLPSVSWYIL